MNFNNLCINIQTPPLSEDTLQRLVPRLNTLQTFVKFAYILNDVP